MSLFEFIDQGGPVMYALLAMSVLALAILLLKLVQFTRLGLRRTGFVDGVQKLVREGQADRALEALRSVRNPVARVLESAIRVGRSTDMDAADCETEVMRIGSREVRDLESWLRPLSSIAHLSPFLGLLGTVLGMIAAFMQIEAAGSHVDASKFSGGIWEALLTTAFGLTIAIPAMAAYFYLEGEVDRVRGVMKDAATQILLRFRKSRPEPKRGPVLVEESDRSLQMGDRHGV